MLTTRFFLLVSALFILTNSYGQVSFSIGTSNKFQTDNNYVGPTPFFGSGLKSKVREEYWIDSYSIGMDYKRNKFNLMVDVCLSTNKLKVSSSSNYASGNGYGYNSTTKTYNYSINYGYFGLKISPQRNYEINENFDLSIGPFFQFQLRVYEREYDHLRTDTYYHNYNYTGTPNIYESTSTDTEEFNGMDITRESGLLGVYIYPKVKFSNYFITLFLSGGLGSTSRRNLIEGDAAWEDKIYGFCEIGFKFGYGLKHKRNLKSSAE